jgi:hypothetical protein
MDLHGESTAVHHPLHGGSRDYLWTTIALIDLRASALGSSRMKAARSVQARLRRPAARRQAPTFCVVKAAPQRIRHFDGTRRERD